MSDNLNAADKMQFDSKFYRVFNSCSKTSKILKPSYITIFRNVTKLIIVSGFLVKYRLAFLCKSVKTTVGF